MTMVSRFENWSSYCSVNQVLADHRPAVLYDVVHFRLLCKEYLTLVKKIRSLFSGVISEHFSKNRMIISVVAAKIWYLINVRFLLGHPVCIFLSLFLC